MTMKKHELDEKKLQDASLILDEESVQKRSSVYPAGLA